MSEKLNQKADYCDICDTWVEAGNGLLRWQPGPDDGGDVVGRTPAGYFVICRNHEQCQKNLQDAREQVKQRQEAERQAILARREEEARVLAERKKIAADLLATVPECVCTGYDWDNTFLMGVKGESVPGLPGWRKYTVDGVVCYGEYFGNAFVLHAPKSLVIRAWESFPNLSRYSHSEDLAKEFSPESLSAWLAKYGPENPRVMEARKAAEAGEDVPDYRKRPCAGWEVRAYKAGRVDLLTAEGVL